MIGINMQEKKTFTATAAADFLGMTYPKFRKIQSVIPSTQLWNRDPRLYEQQALEEYARFSTDSNDNQ